MDRSRISAKRITRIAIFAALLFIQEELLSFIPNVQFTQCLIAVYFYSFGLVDTLIIVCIHVLFDNLFLGSLSFMYTPAMLFGWISLVLILQLIKKIKNKLIISAIVGLHGILYSWSFVFISCVFFDVPFNSYVIPDIPFEIILVINGFVTTFILLNPLTNLLKKLIGKEEHKRTVYCGYDCQTCPIYEATINKNDDEIIKIIKTDDVLKNVKDYHCLGCKSNKTSKICNNCNIKKCCNEKKIKNCGFCKDYPCEYVTNNLSKLSLDKLNEINQGTKK